MASEPIQAVEEELARVRWHIGRLAASRLLVAFEPEDQARYEEAIRRERELLSVVEAAGR